jgi:hypothetical protein
MTQPPIKIEVDPATTSFEHVEDKRPRVPEPPPVRLVAVEDCNLLAVAGIETDLDAFYVGLLGFEREAADGLIVYRAENFRLRFAIVECPESREDYRPLGIATPSLAELAQRFTDAEIEFVRQRGLTPGVEFLLLSDPAGNPLEISEFGIAI